MGMQHDRLRLKRAAIHWNLRPRLPIEDGQISHYSSSSERPSGDLNQGDSPEVGSSMFSIIGILLVFAAVLGGFLMEKGPLLVLMQPSELVIIGGAAIGTMLAANPMHVIKKIIAGLTGVLSGSKYSKARYVESLKMMFQLFNKARKDGLVGIETDIEEPEKSSVFSKYPNFLKNHHARDFVCDTMRMAVTGGATPFDLDQMMELDMDVHHAGASLPVTALSTIADSLPGLGIVAAVLGVVVTMSALGGPPEEIGHKVASALVGTFLGILLCYGMIGPLLPICPNWSTMSTPTITFCAS